MHKWSGRVQWLNRMVEACDLLPLHKPVWEWPEHALERLDDAVLDRLSDETLERIFDELSTMCGDEDLGPAEVETRIDTTPTNIVTSLHGRPPLMRSCACGVCEDVRRANGIAEPPELVEARRMLRRYEALNTRR
jgi:hypothetical protein